MNARASLLICGGLIALAASGCMEAYRKSVVGQTPKVFDRIYLTDYNTAWAGVKEALKSTRIDVDNKEGGLLQTRWMDNTAERNFVDNFGGADLHLKAQYRFKLTVAPGAYNGKPSVRVTVQKDQLTKRDVLEGWRPVETDAVDENTLLYRIGRIIFMRMKLAQAEEERKHRELEATKF